MTPIAARANPFPGLAPFDEQDADRFFGRDQEVEEILDRLASRRLLAVIGVSGCGKSSLVRAGVLPALRLGAADNLPGRWRIHTITPGNAPLDALRRTMDAPATWPSTSFDLVEHARATLQVGEKLLLIVDQFEELFSFRAASLDRDAGDAAALFVNLLLNAVDQREVPIYVLLTMRTDFLGECAQFRGLPEALNDCYYLVPRMTRTQQQEAIEWPLEEQGVAIAPALVQRLLNDSAEDPDHLPVLQHLLKRLWENWEASGASGPIGDEDYKAVGGWKKAIKQDANAVLFKFWADVDRIERVFRWITDRGTGERPVRRPRPFEECVEVSGLAPEHLRQIVEAFQERGLLRQSALVDLQHESVMWQWEELASWIHLEAEYAAQLRFLCQSARQKVPLVGLALVSALKLRGATRFRYLRKEEVQEIDSWVRRSRRRQVLTWAGIGAVVILLAGLAGWISVTSVRQRNSAQARELSAWAAVSLGDDPERSLILGLYAWGKQRSMVPGLKQSLHDGLVQSQVRRTIRGHQDKVNSVAWSPDASKLATASEDGTAKVWDARTGRELFTLRGHQGGATSVAWSSDGRKLATASDDKTAKVWDAVTGRELLTLKGHQDPVTSVTWSPDGSKLATASDDKTAKVWDADTGRELLTLRGHENYVLSVAWSPDGDKLATASSDNRAKIWAAGTGRELLTLIGHQGAVDSVAWSLDGRKLATASYDLSVRVWDASTGRLLTLHGLQSAINCVAWSPDGSKLATASDDSTAKVWDADAGNELLSLRGHRNAVLSVAWSLDGRKLATASKDHTAKLWESQGGGELLTLRGRQSAVRGVGWSPDGGKLAAAGDGEKVGVWESDTGRELLTLPGRQLCVAWSPDGSKLATGNADKTAMVWDAGTGRELLTLRGHQNSVLGVAWSPDGRKLATASADKTVKVWDVGAGRELLTLSGFQEYVWSAAWSPDSRRLATASWEDTAKVWDAGTGRELLTLSGHHGFVLSVAWSPDGNKLATASGDGTAKVWEAATGRELLTLSGHQNSAGSVAWSPDGRMLATSSADTTAKVWEADTGRDLLTLHGQQKPIYCVAWSPDGKKLASASKDGTVQIYAIDHDLLLNLVRSRITRDLTPDECRRYLNTDRCPPLPRVP